MAETITVDELEVPVHVDRNDLREWVGDVPETVAVDRVYRWEGILVGETIDAGRGAIIEVHYKVDDISGDLFMEAHEIGNPSGVDEAGEVVWERHNRAEKELSELVCEGGLSAAQALDYWMVEIRGRTASAWAEFRRTSHQAVSKNVREARQILAE